jgi:sugar O-acyltransferase (sialic acid O-acetyltransferase NeuD family)
MSINNLTDVILLSSGIHGREMAEIIRRNGGYRLLGVIRAEKTTEQTSPDGIPVLGGPSALQSFPGTALVHDNEWPIEHLNDPDIFNRLTTLIDPAAFVHPSAVLGRGCVVYPNCFIGAEAEAGESCFLLSGAAVNHNCVLGKRVVMATGAHLAGSVRVCDMAYIGQDATVRQNLSIGANSLVGMGAVVIKSVPDNAVVGGNPAKIIRMK